MTYDTTFTADDRAKFTEVGELLGGWVVDQPHDHNHNLRLQHDGRVLWVHLDYRTGRYEVRGELPARDVCFSRSEEADGIKGSHSIGLARSKSAKQIAADITRRLLPDYERSYLVVVERVDARNAAKAKLAAELAALAAVAPGLARVDTDRDGDATGVSVAYNVARTYGDFRSSTYKGHTEYTVKLENVSPELAAQILALVATTRI